MQTIDFFLNYESSFALIAAPSRGGSLERFIKLLRNNNLKVEYLNLEND